MTFIVVAAIIVAAVVLFLLWRKSRSRPQQLQQPSIDHFNTAARAATRPAAAPLGQQLREAERVNLDPPSTRRPMPGATSHHRSDSHLILMGQPHVDSDGDGLPDQMDPDPFDRRDDVHVPHDDALRSDWNDAGAPDPAPDRISDFGTGGDYGSGDFSSRDASPAYEAPSAPDPAPTYEAPSSSGSDSSNFSGSD